jgi:RimJ/RimL family protein N-acetyltransferase
MKNSNHIHLDALTEEDIAILFCWINDREQVLFNAPYKPVHEGSHRAWFESIQQRSDLVMFAIRLCKSNKLIGSCQLHSITPVHRSAELQIRLGDVTEHGHGYGTEATKKLLDFAFNDLNLHRVYLHVFSNNIVAIRMYKKIGFVQEGILRKAAYINGTYIDVLVMGLLREEYDRP